MDRVQSIQFDNIWDKMNDLYENKDGLDEKTWLEEYEKLGEEVDRLEADEANFCIVDESGIDLGKMEDRDQNMDFHLEDLCDEQRNKDIELLLINDLLNGSRINSPQHQIVYKRDKIGKYCIKNEEKSYIFKYSDDVDERNRNACIIGLRYGLFDGKPRNLAEVGEIFDVTKEKIRQIEAKALQNLRHPSFMKIFLEYRSYKQSGRDELIYNNYGEFLSDYIEHTKYPKVAEALQGVLDVYNARVNAGIISK